MQDTLFLTAQHAAATLGVNEQTIRRYIRRGRLRAAKLDRSYRISREDWQAFVDSLYAATFHDLAPGAPRPSLQDAKPRRGRPRRTRHATPAAIGSQPELNVGQPPAPAPGARRRTLTEQERNLLRQVVVDNAKNPTLWSEIVRMRGEHSKEQPDADYARAREILTDVIINRQWDFLQHLVPGVAGLIIKNFPYAGAVQSVH